MASYGQATYETEYNGGMGSNGLTSARHDVFGKYLAEKYPESFDAAVPNELVYSGNTKLTDEVENSPIDAGKLVLSPTRTYAPIIKKVFRAIFFRCRFTEWCIAVEGHRQRFFILWMNLHIVKNNMFPIPPLVQVDSGAIWYRLERNVSSF